MSAPHDSDRAHERDDARFVAELREHYAPDPMTPARRRAFDDALQARLEARRGRPRIFVAALATAAAASAIAGLILAVSGPETAPTPVAPESRLAVEGPTGAPGWEYELFYPRELVAPGESDESTLLPDEYVAIASLFLDG